MAVQRTDKNLNGASRSKVAIKKMMVHCSVCQKYLTFEDMEANGVDERALLHIFDKALKAYGLKQMIHENEVHGKNHVLPKKAKPNGNGRHCGEWAFTLTMSPNDGLTETDLINAVKKIMAQGSCPVKKYAWYLEHKENDKHPHIHGIYETESGGRIESKHWKRAWPIWDEKRILGAGFRGGYHRPVVDNDEYRKYIAKDNGTHAVKGFINGETRVG